MVHLTAPVTKRQLELLRARQRLERRLSFDTLPANGYGLVTRVEGIDAELRAIEADKGKRVAA